MARRAQFVIVCGEGEDGEVWGIYTSRVTAEAAADAYNESAIRPYFADVVEVFSARDLARQIREEAD